MNFVRLFCSNPEEERAVPEVISIPVPQDLAEAHRLHQTGFATGMAPGDADCKKNDLAHEGGFFVERLSKFQVGELQWCN